MRESLRRISAAAECRGIGSEMAWRVYFLRMVHRFFSEFELLAADEGAADPDMISTSMYRVIYDIVTEDGETFLRFSHFEKG